MKLRWSLRAERDLFRIGDHIARDDPEAAVRWITKLRDRMRRAARMPTAGRKVPELDIDAVREVFLGTYRLVYRIEPRSVCVLAVFEGHKMLPADLD